MNFDKNDNLLLLVSILLGYFNKILLPGKVFGDSIVFLVATFYFMNTMSFWRFFTIYFVGICLGNLFLELDNKYFS